MARGNLIPYDIIRLIIIHLASPSVESLDDWAECMNVLGVSRMWRSIGEPMLYANVVIDLGALHNGILDFHSNTSLVVSNSFENHVRAAVVHIAPDMNRLDAIAAFFWHMPNNLTNSLKNPSTMRKIWRGVGTPTPLLSGVCIEPLLLVMPNLRYLCISTMDWTKNGSQQTSVFLNYSIARQSSSRDNLFNKYGDFDFIAYFRHERIPALNMQTAMARMTHVPNNSKQTPASTSRKSVMPSNNRVQFCAEYIRKLRILNLPQSALNLDASIDALRDRNPCALKENFVRSWWFNIRDRSSICVPNIWFENSRVGITRYDLFAFNRSANDHMLQIATSIPAEISEPAQLLDNSSEDSSSSSYSDDGYFSF